MIRTLRKHAFGYDLPIEKPWRCVNSPGRDQHRRRVSVMGKRTCVIDGCDRQLRSEFLCPMHYSRWVQNGSTYKRKVKRTTLCLVPGCVRVQHAKYRCAKHYHDFWERRTAARGRYSVCTIEGCETRAEGLGLCLMHRKRFKKHGDPNQGARVFAKAVDGMKRCSCCKITKPIAEFCQSKNTADGLNWACRLCIAERQNTPRYRELNQRYKAQLLERNLHANDKWQFKRYGVGLDWYAKTLAAQDGVCAICKEPPKGRRLFIDHDHACCGPKRACTQCVRGLLCAGCNTAVGWLENRTPDVLDRLHSYVARELA